MNQALSAFVQSLAPPVVWNAYLRLRGRPLTFPWLSFGTISTCVDTAPLLKGKFAEVYSKYHSLEPHVPIDVTRYRHYNICYFANLCREVSGDFLCAGVSWGLAPRVVYDFTNFSTLGKKLHLVDPFEGIVSERPNDISPRYNRDPDYVLRQYPSGAPIELHRERIPLDTIPNKLAFVFTDTGNVAADTAAIPSFYEALSPGGVIITEQYADDLTLYDSVINRLGATAMWLPSGQGAIFKR